MSEYASDFLDTFKFHSDKNMPPSTFSEKIDRPSHGPAITRNTADGVSMTHINDSPLYLRRGNRHI